MEYWSKAANPKINNIQGRELSSLHWQNFLRKYLASIIVLFPLNPFKYGLQLRVLLLRREINVLLP